MKDNNTPTKEWIVGYNGKRCVPDLNDFKLQGDSPQLVFAYEGKLFYVEFRCKSDYFAARDSSVQVDVLVISANRTNRFKGTIIHKLTCYGLLD